MKVQKKKTGNTASIFLSSLTTFIMKTLEAEMKEKEGKRTKERKEIFKR